METFFILLFLGLIVFVIWNFTSGSYKVSEKEFEQAGVKVIFETGKIIIKGNTYDVNEIQGITSTKVSKVATEVRIQVDDFHRPIHKIGISGFDDAGEKFIQRLSTALRKAGGPSFY